MAAGASVRLGFPGDSCLAWSSGRLGRVLPMWGQVSLRQFLVVVVTLSELYPLVVVFGHLLLVLRHFTGSLVSYFIQTV